MVTTSGRWRGFVSTLFSNASFREFDGYGSTEGGLGIRADLGLTYQEDSVIGALTVGGALGGGSGDRSDFSISELFGAMQLNYDREILQPFFRLELQGIWLEGDSDPYSWRGVGTKTGLGIELIASESLSIPVMAYVGAHRITHVTINGEESQLDKDEAGGKFTMSTVGISAGLSYYFPISETPSGQGDSSQKPKSSKQ